jgi:hypothetical protein
MKLSNKHQYYNGLCHGCLAAVEQKDIDPDSLYRTWLCDRCRVELEQLPPRHKVVFDRLKLETDRVAGTVKFLDRKIEILERFMIAHGLNPQEAR